MTIVYRLVRVNDENHPRWEDAVEDMRTIIDCGAYWTRRESPPELPAGTPIVAMGSHGGRGLFLHGIVSGEWVAEPDDSPYRHQISVTWADAIYEADADAVAGCVEALNPRSMSHMTQAEYRTVMAHLLSAEPIAG
jgi:hypothetical protein